VTIDQIITDLVEQNRIGRASDATYSHRLVSAIQSNDIDEIDQVIHDAVETNIRGSDSGNWDPAGEDGTTDKPGGDSVDPEPSQDERSESGS